MPIYNLWIIEPSSTAREQRKIFINRFECHPLLLQSYLVQDRAEVRAAYVCGIWINSVVLYASKGSKRRRGCWWWWRCIVKGWNCYKHYNLIYPSFIALNPSSDSSTYAGSPSSTRRWGGDSSRNTWQLYYRCTPINRMWRNTKR